MSLASIVTPSLLNSLRTHPGLPPNTWYFITSTALSTLNRPDEIPKVFEHALENAPESSGSLFLNGQPFEQLGVARRTREALIKSSAIVGLPKTINALFALKAATPTHLLDEPLGFSPAGRALDVSQTTSSQILQRGQRFFDQVYGKVTNRVMGQMDRSGTEDLGLCARLEYGYILSPTGVLDAMETSFVVLASLIPQDVNPQLKGHLVGALNNGATREQVSAVRDVVVKICEAGGMRKLDKDSVDAWGWRQDVAGLKPEKIDGASEAKAKL